MITRTRCAFLVTLLIAVGLASRRYLPVETFLIGSILWAAMLFFVVAFVSPQANLKSIALVTLVLSIGVEVIHLFPLRFMDRVRENYFGYLVVGKGFSFEDMMWYAVGILGAYWYARERIGRGS